MTVENNDEKLCSTVDYKGFRFADGWARVSGVESRGEKGGRAGAVSRVVARMGGRAGAASSGVSESSVCLSFGSIARNDCLCDCLRDCLLDCLLDCLYCSAGGAQRVFVRLFTQILKLRLRRRGNCLCNICTRNVCVCVALRRNFCLGGSLLLYLSLEVTPRVCFCRAVRIRPSRCRRIEQFRGGCRIFLLHRDTWCARIQGVEVLLG